jgi:hypothetical protein
MIYILCVRKRVLYTLFIEFAPFSQLSLRQYGDLYTLCWEALGELAFPALLQDWDLRCSVQWNDIIPNQRNQK